MGIGSEVGALETVLLHRPSLELRRITPSNMDELLFDELLWVEHAQAEHDEFAELLREQGVEVLHLERLLAEVLADADLVGAVVDQHVTAATTGPSAVGPVREFLTGLAPQELVDHLVGGVTLEEAGPVDGLIAAAAAAHDLLLDPLPNTVFMRDSSAWIGDGVVLAPMNRPVRRRETDLLRLLYLNHPRFRGTRIWFGGDVAAPTGLATFEGGDLLVVGPGGLAVGLSERSTSQGVETLAAALFARKVVDRVLAVDLPKVRAAMHLDTIVSQVDADTFLTYPSMTSGVRCWALTPGPDHTTAVAELGSLREGLAWAADLDDVRTIEPAFTSTRAEREQWNDANNTLALRPGVVVAYERNVATNEVLADAGVEVLTIPSYELPRGRGGPRCMSCPVSRAALP